MRFNKYGAKRTTHAGRSFASKLEAALYDFLVFREKIGEVKDIRQQPSVYLTEARIHMIPDFVAYDCALKKDVYWEAKGIEMPTYRIKRKLWTVYGPSILRVYVAGKGNRGPVLKEEIVPGKSNAKLERDSGNED